MRKVSISKGMMAAGVAMAALAWPTVGSAQALNPAVDVCTGLSINRSAVTEIVGAVNTPIVGSIQTVVNRLVNVTAILPGATILAPLDIDLQGILAAVAAGDPISVQVLDTNGNIVSPSGGCRLATDGVTLNTEAGIALGGNGLTGLGSAGRLASAGTLDAIAIGNDASTDAAAGAAVAIGENASVTGLGSVALGAGSVADRAATVSIGTVGAERQLVNVAAGTQATDATNLGQVQGLIAGASALDVVYDDASRSRVTFAGPTGTVLAGVAAGEISATSSQAVNGSQLFATNQLVAGNAQAITTLDGRVAATENGIAALDARVTTNTGDISALGDRVTVNTGAIASLDGRVGTVEGRVTGLDGRLSTVEGQVAGLDGRVAGIDGRLGTVEGQVAGLDGRVTGVEGRLGTVEGAVTSLDGRLGAAEGDIVALDGRVGVAEGRLDGLDGRVTANESAIAGLDGRVTANEGAIAGLDGRVTGAEGRIDGLDGRVTTNEGDILALDGRLTVNEGDIVDLDARVTDNSTRITNLTTQVANVPIAYARDDDPTVRSATPTDTVLLVGASGGAVVLAGVADGEVATGSTQAVNGGQLAATNARVGAAETAIAANRADIDRNTLDIDELRRNQTGSTIVAVQYSDPSNPTVSNGGSITNDVTLVGADASAPVGLHNVADGRSATDAVNLRQLQASASSALSNAMAYTDQRLLAYDTRLDGFGARLDAQDARLQSIAFDLGEVRREAHAGTAGAAALATLPQPMDAGRSMLSGSVGHHRGETAFALGFSSALGEDWVVKAGASVDTRGNGTFGAGAGFQF